MLLRTVLRQQAQRNVSACASVLFLKLLHRYGLSVTLCNIAATTPPSAQRSDTDERNAV